MHIPMIPPSTIRHLSIFVLLYSTLIQNYVVAIPHVVDRRQTSLLSALQLPTCAIQCVLMHLFNDGCTSEADFACHCAGGKLAQASLACIMQGCGTTQGDDAFSKLNMTCGKVAGSESSEAQVTSTGSATAASQTNNGKGPTASTPSGAGNPITNAMTYQATIRISATPIASIPTRSAKSTLHNVSQTGTPTSTETPIPPLQKSGQLSAGAKVGLGVSLAALPIVAAAILAWYIYRLKRRVYAAQQSKDPSGTLDPIPAMRRRCFTKNAYPISPLSPSYPGGMQDETTVSDIGYGMVMKKRGHVLSALLERDEDHTSVNEPVPGQREGLVPPLELDAEATAVSELPTITTPRSRSVER